MWKCKKCGLKWNGGRNFEVLYESPEAKLVKCTRCGARHTISKPWGDGGLRLLVTCNSEDMPDERQAKI